MPKCTCIADTSGDLNLSTEYYSLLIVNAQNKRCGNRTTTKGGSVAGRRNGVFDKMQRGDGSMCEREIEYM